MSGHGVGQRGKVGGEGTVAINGVSSVNSFVYGRERQGASHQYSHQLAMSCVEWCACLSYLEQLMDNDQ